MVELLPVGLGERLIFVLGQGRVHYCSPSGRRRLRLLLCRLVCWHGCFNFTIYCSVGRGHFNQSIGQSVDPDKRQGGRSIQNLHQKANNDRAAIDFEPPARSGDHAPVHASLLAYVPASGVIIRLLSKPTHAACDHHHNTHIHTQAGLGGKAASRASLKSHNGAPVGRPSQFLSILLLLLCDPPLSDP